MRERVAADSSPPLWTGARLFLVSPRLWVELVCFSHARPAEAQCVYPRVLLGGRRGVCEVYMGLSVYILKGFCHLEALPARHAREFQLLRVLADAGSCWHPPFSF